MFRAIGNVFKAILKNPIVRAVIQIAACAAYAPACAAITAGITLLAGGTFADAMQAGIFSFISMGVWSSVSNMLTPILGGIAQSSGDLAAMAVKSAVHGVVGGALSVAQGGTFMDGFAANAIGGAAGYAAGESGMFGKSGTPDGLFARTAIAATAGGLAAELTGGKFANGAITAGMAHLFNNEGMAIWPALETARQIGMAIGYFARNRADMNEANTRDSDTFFHCKANCQSSKEGPVGEWTAVVLSQVREVNPDMFGPGSAQDQVANAYGRYIASELPLRCSAGCGLYRPKALPEKYWKER